MSRHHPARALSGLGATAVLLASLAPGLPTARPAAAAPTLRVSAEQLGFDRIGVRRGATWRLADSLDGARPTDYREGPAGWVPVAGDTNGDGTATVSLFRDGVWRLRDATRGPVRTFRFGVAGDVPVVGDWNADGVDTVGVFRRGRWLLREANAAGPSRSFVYGRAGDRPVVGDWDGDGGSDIAVQRGNQWHQRDAPGAGPTSRVFRLGVAGDVPVAGDWDHDGRDTPGLFRRGTWIFQQGNGFGRTQVAYLGRAGDRPVVRRTPGLAAGVSHRVVRRGSALAHVATVELAAASSPDTVLSQNRLLGLERTSQLARRAGAALAINGDYALPNGRPVHLFAADGRLGQTPQLIGRAFGIDAAGTQVPMGSPTVATTVTASTGDTTTATIDLPRWNSGRPDGDAFAAYTAVGEDLETPPDGVCYAGLERRSGPQLGTDGTVRTSMAITGTRCGGPAPAVDGSTIMLATNRFHAGEPVVRELRKGPAQLSMLVGFPGAVDAMGGSPLLLSHFEQQRQDLSGDGGFFGPNPRTALGVTADGRLLLVVVDGRQSGYSSGMGLQELADLMTSLGARDAINLDGGGSSTMWLNGLVVNRPSDGPERAVSSALVVLPGGDPGEADVTLAPLTADTAALRGADAVPALPDAGPPAAGTPGAGAPVAVRPAAGAPAAALTDPASTGGLADALSRSGVDLPPALELADRSYDARRP